MITIPQVQVGTYVDSKSSEHEYGQQINTKMDEYDQSHISPTEQEATNNITNGDINSIVNSESASEDNEESISINSSSSTTAMPESKEITATATATTPEIQIQTTTRTPETAPKRKWAYAYLIGGCSSQTPKYHAYIYNAIVVSRRMKEYGSKADIIVMIQMWGKSDETALPQEDVDMLEDAGVKIVYIPKLAPYMQEVFYTLMLEKFRILTLTDYSRVLYMDGDVIPTCNLDYLFDLSEPEDGIEPLLKENLIIGWKGEPASGGFFMFRPDMDDWAVMQQIIRDREEEILTMEYPWWNATIGWGHQIELPDFWDAPSSKGNEWTWYGAFADQGLLYYWPKYVKQSVTIINYNKARNWSSRNGTAYLEKEMTSIFDSYSCKDSGKPSPYRDFIHFTGEPKPWTSICESHRDRAGMSEWLKTIKEYEEEKQITLNSDHVCKKSINPVVVGFPTYIHMYNNTIKKQAHNWEQYVTTESDE